MAHFLFGMVTASRLAKCVDVGDWDVGACKIHGRCEVKAAIQGRLLSDIEPWYFKDGRSSPSGLSVKQQVEQCGRHLGSWQALLSKYFST